MAERADEATIRRRVRQMTKPHLLVILNGAPRAGKDTVAQVMIEPFRENPDWVVGHWSTIETPRLFLQEKYRINPDRKSPEDRKLLSDIAAALDAHPDNPRAAEIIRLVERLIDSYGQDDRRVMVVTHMREPASIARLLVMVNTRWPNGKVRPVRVRVDKPGEAGRFSNSSDADALNSPADMVIVNDGSLDDLQKKVSEVLAIITV